MLRGMTKTEVMAIIHEAFLALEAEGLFARTGEVENGNIVWRATDPAMARPDAPPLISVRKQPEEANHATRRTTTTRGHGGGRAGELRWALGASTGPGGTVLGHAGGGTRL